MEILRQDLPALFDTGASGGPSPGDAMTLALTDFEARTDMLERNRAASDGAPRAGRVKTPEEKWGRCWRERSACTDELMRVDYRRCTLHLPLHQREGRGSRCRVSTRPAQMLQARRRPFRLSVSPPQKAHS